MCGSRRTAHSNRTSEGRLSQEISAKPDLTQVIPLLERDASNTLGESYSQLIEDTAADVRELGIGDGGDKLVNDVQQYFHDSSVNATWPTCPRHGRHPLWYRRGAWWCVEDGVAVAQLGELPKAR